MRVTDVDAIPVSISLKDIERPLGVAPYVASYERGSFGGETEATDRLLIRIDTDVGVTGWGETAPLPTPTIARDVIRDVFAPALSGQPVSGFHPHEDTFDYDYLNLDAIQGGVDIAMWDALGKHRDVPVHELIGGKHTKNIPIAHCVGILDSKTSRTKARRAIEAGFDVLKTKVGPDLKRDVERIEAMHDEVDGQLDFRLDANQTFSFAEAVQFASMLEDSGIRPQYLEQPLTTSSFGAYAKLRTRTHQPLAVNEDLYHRYHLEYLIKHDAIDVAVIDLVPAGGFLAAQNLASVATAADLSVAHHSSADLGIKTAAMLHLVASTPAIDLAADRLNHALVDDIIRPRLSVEKGTIPVPTAPGLGVTIDAEAVERYRID